jgi:hypothetical protein
MRRMLWWCRAGVVVLLALSGCAGAPKLTDDGRRIQDVDAFVAAIGHAYERRDAAGVMNAVAQDFADRDALRRELEATFARFDAIGLALTIERIHLDGDAATVYLRWDGRWRAAEREPILRQGAARFLVRTRERSELAAVVGDTPFGPVGTAAAVAP